jgi:ATP-dependent DNA helicase RecQ
LHSLGFKATYYHGGLTSREKDKTCSFGWTIRPRLLLPQMHLEWALTKQMSRPLFTSTSENIENYYQEAGRSGRNGEKAFAVLLTNPSDIKQAENQFIHILPDKKFLNEMYNKLCNFFKLLMEKGSTKDSPLT